MSKHQGYQTKKWDLRLRKYRRTDNWSDDILDVVQSTNKGIDQVVVLQVGVLILLNSSIIFIVLSVMFRTKILQNCSNYLKYTQLLALNHYCHVISGQETNDDLKFSYDLAVGRTHDLLYSRRVHFLTTTVVVTGFETMLHLCYYKLNVFIT